jgi:hypothetical protein
LTSPFSNLGAPWLYLQVLHLSGAHGALFADRKISKRLLGVRLGRRLGGPELGLCFKHGRSVAKPSILGQDNSVDGVKFGFQTLKSTIVFPRELLDELVKLTLRSNDLLPKQIGTVLQVATDIAH